MAEINMKALGAAFPESVDKKTKEAFWNYIEFGKKPPKELTNEEVYETLNQMRSDVVGLLREHIKGVFTTEQYDLFLKHLSSPQNLDHFDSLSFYMPFVKAIETDGVDGAFEFLKSITSASAKKGNVTTGNKINPLNSIVPENFYMTNSKVANELSKNFPVGKTVGIALESKGSKKEITTYATLNYEDGVSYSRLFSSYDKVVHNAICTLYEAGNSTFTAEMVYRAMNGMTKSEMVSKQAVAAVTKSIEKSRFTKLTIDRTEEAKAWNVEVDKVHLSNMILAVDEIDVSISGVTKKAYSFNRVPILYEYSKQLGHIISVPIKLLGTNAVINNTDEISVLKTYLLKRIELMKYKNNNVHNNKITFEAIYEELQLENVNKDKLSRVRNNTKTILEYWKKVDYIKSFKEYKDGKTIVGVEITY